MLDSINSRTLRRTLSATLRRVKEGQGYTVTIAEFPVAVLISVDEYRRLQRAAGESEGE